MAQIKCVCISNQRKSSRVNVHQCHAGTDGLTGDIHQGKNVRQVSMLPLDQICAYFNEKKEPLQYGRFGENLVVDGLDWDNLRINDLLRAETVLLQIIRIGAGGPKSAAYKGKKVCVPMEKSFVFCKILQEGTLHEGMELIKEDNNEMH